jgi:hypothetical protein
MTIESWKGPKAKLIEQPHPAATTGLMSYNVLLTLRSLGSQWYHWLFKSWVAEVHLEALLIGPLTHLTPSLAAMQ